MPYPLWSTKRGVQSLVVSFEDLQQIPAGGIPLGQGDLTLVQSSEAQNDDMQQQQQWVAMHSQSVASTETKQSI